MVVFNLNDKYRLTSSARQWTLEKRGIKTDDSGEKVEYWTGIRYYGTLPSAVQACYTHFQRQIDADNILDFISESEKLLESYAEIFNPVLVIKLKEK